MDLDESLDMMASRARALLQHEAPSTPDLRRRQESLESQRLVNRELYSMAAAAVGAAGARSWTAEQQRQTEASTASAVQASKARGALRPPLSADDEALMAGLLNSSDVDATVDAYLNLRSSGGSGARSSENGIVVVGTSRRVSPSLAGASFDAAAAAVRSSATASGAAAVFAESSPEIDVVTYSPPRQQPQEQYHQVEENAGGRAGRVLLAPVKSPVASRRPHAQHPQNPRTTRRRDPTSLLKSYVITGNDNNNRSFNADDFSLISAGRGDAAAPVGAASAGAVRAARGDEEDELLEVVADDDGVNRVSGYFSRSSGGATLGWLSQAASSTAPATSPSPQADRKGRGSPVTTSAAVGGAKAINSRSNHVVSESDFEALSGGAGDAFEGETIGAPPPPPAAAAAAGTTSAISSQRKPPPSAPPAPLSDSGSGSFTSTDSDGTEDDTAGTTDTSPEPRRVQHQSQQRRNPQQKQQVQQRVAVPGFRNVANSNGQQRSGKKVVTFPNGGLPTGSINGGGGGRVGAAAASMPSALRAPPSAASVQQNRAAASASPGRTPLVVSYSDVIPRAQFQKLLSTGSWMPPPRPQHQPTQSTQSSNGGISVPPVPPRPSVQQPPPPPVLNRDFPPPPPPPKVGVTRCC